VLDELEEQQQQRLLKVHRLRQHGIEPYPHRFRRSHTAAEALEAFQRLQGDPVTVAGRLRSIRIMGKASFAHIADGSGRIQLHFRHDLLGDERYEFVRRYLDLGDIVGATGPLFRTKTGEVTVEVRDFAMLAKAINPPPEKWHGLTDIEKRYRQRYVDLMVNENSRRVFLTRTQLVRAIRSFLDAEGFMEVETPILQPIYGGAVARPFVTHHHALDQQLYLRIADELYLKRLIVGGFEKVYEIGKDFRNEGISTQHNPEFTMLELYQAYADYNDIMDLVERLISTVSQQVMGTLRVTYQGRELNFTPPWPRVTLRELVERYSGIDYTRYPDADSLREAALKAGAEVPPGAHRGKIVDALMKRFVEDHLSGPIFVVDYPVELSPLAKRKPEDPTHVERFETYMAGMEICNAFTELNDPLDQYERFLQQLEFRKAGDVEAHEMDEDFINALMYGMPPTGGLGIGIDRLTMVLTDQPSIRDVILFPHMRPRRD
jgi:lysyl-tRNA synthetase class 2